MPRSSASTGRTRLPAMRTGRPPYDRLRSISEWTRRPPHWVEYWACASPALDLPCTMREVDAWMGFRFAGFGGPWVTGLTPPLGC
jgi:hypothetical protein